MPLLGKFIFREYSRTPINEEETFRIDFTNEIFSSKRLYEEKLKLYNSKLWTCQATSTTNQTYKEALELEKSCHEKLKKKFIPSIEKTMLELIHHSNLSLEAITLEAKKLLENRFYEGEILLFEPAPGKKFTGSIVGFTKELAVKEEGSPSSDKENKAKQKLITDMFKQVQSPEKKQEKPKSHIEIYKYNLRLSKENKIVNGIPENLLSRTNKPISTGMIKLFIRYHALMHKYNGAKAWIVNKELVNKYNLKSKFSADLETAYTKNATADLKYIQKFLNVNTNGGLSNGSSESTDTKTLDKNSSDETTTTDNDNKTVDLTNSPRKMSDNSTGLKSLKTPIVNGGLISDDDDDIPLSSLFNVNKKKKLLSPSKTNASVRKNSSPKKKKQATLLELTTRKGGMKLMKSVKSSPMSGSPKTTPRKYRQPPVVYKLLSLKKEKTFRQYAYRKYEIIAAKSLTFQQIEKIPEHIRAPILARKKEIERKEKWHNMTREERKQYIAEKKLEQKTNLTDDQRIVAMGNSKPLPQYDLVTLDARIPNTAFGDVAMVVEFLNAYKNCIFPSSDSTSITCESLIKALTSGTQGDMVLSNTLSQIFVTLLSDQIAEEYLELGFHLKQVEVTPAICSELARICFRKFDDNEDDEESNAIPTELSEKVYERLLENEIFELEPMEQLEILTALVNRILATNRVENRLADSVSDVSERRKAYMSLRTGISENNQKEVEEDKEKEEQNKQAELALTNTIKELKENADMVARVKNRKLITEKTRMLEEIERQKLEKKDKIYKKKQELAKKMKEYQNHCKLRQRLIRSQPLGVDRNHSRYWCFCNEIPGLYIEKGWSQYVEYNCYDNNSEDAEPSNKETTFPPVGQNLWFVLNSKEDFDKLIENLCKDGIRESELKKSLQSHYSIISQSIDKYQSSSFYKKNDQEEDESPEPPRFNLRKRVYNAQEDALNSLHKNLIAFAREVSQGGLAELDLTLMEVRINSSEKLTDFKPIMIDLLDSIKENCLNKYMTASGSKGEKKPNGESEQQGDKWKSAVQNANHLSRLLLLYNILNESIKWELYHYQRTRKATRKNYAEMAEGQSQEESEEEEKQEEAPLLRSKRSLRLQNRNQAKEESSAEESEEDEDAKNTSRSSRKRTSRCKNKSEDDGSGSSGETGRYGLRKRKRRSNDESEDQSEEEVNNKRKTRRTTRNSLRREQTPEESSEEEEEEEEESMEEGNEDVEPVSEGSDNEEDNSSSESEVEDETIPSDEETDICKTVVRKMKEYKCSQPFKYPIDPEDVVDYYEIIENPISLEDIEKKMDAEDNEYTSNDLVTDMKLLFGNADQYNVPDNDIMRKCAKLINIFKRIFTEKFGRSQKNMEEFEKHFG